jgi:hypothetical protein
MDYVKSTPVSLKDYYDELWLKNKIIEDTSILNLGELVVKDVERIQPKAGRIDLLLHDDEEDIRYEVEIMLGRLDESHIIRAIEYWDIERKRSPTYEHRAVIIAEDITTRFLNIIQLFNNVIPLIAIQLNAAKVNDRLALNFVKILDIMSMENDEDIISSKADRKYWEDRSSKESLEVADGCLAIIKEFDPEYELSYNKYYIGLTKRNHPNNFVAFRPKRKFVRVEAKLPDLESYKKLLEEKDIDVVSIDAGSSRVKFRLIKSELQEKRAIIKQILEASYKEWVS